MSACFHFLTSVWLRCGSINDCSVVLPTQGLDTELCDFITGMWVTGYRTFNHGHQETNNILEGYHSALKARLNQEKAQLCSRRVDWLIYTLTTELLDDMEHRAFSKAAGFVPNVRQEDRAVTAVQQVGSLL